MLSKLDELIKRFPELNEIRDKIEEAYSILRDSFKSGGTLFTCGNGGSASDAEHVVGELLKGFILKRNLNDSIKSIFDKKLGKDSTFFTEKLQSGLKAISLNGHPALSSAYSNDVEPSLVYAQQLFVLSEKDDVLMAFSTSGNSENIFRCIQLASVKGVKTILMTGKSGGRCAEIADCAVKMPETETYKIQELHLPVYHTLCMMLEEEFYGE